LRISKLLEILCGAILVIYKTQTIQQENKCRVPQARRENANAYELL